MKNSKIQLNDKLGVNKIGNNKIKKNPLQHAINIDKNVFSGGLHENSEPNVYHIDKNDFKNVVQHLTGLPSNAPKRESEITRLQKIRPPPLTIARQLDPIPVRVPTPAALQEFPYNELYGPPFQCVTGYPIVDMPWTNHVESPIIAYMRNLRETMMNYDVSRGNQFQSYPLETQVLNNVNAQYQPHYYPIQTQVVDNVEPYQTSYALHPNLVESPIFMTRI